MGLNISWIGVQGLPTEEALSRLGFEPIGDSSDELAAPYSCAATPNGWTIIASTDRWFDIKSILEQANFDQLGIFCSISEATSDSEVRAFIKKKEIWSVIHGNLDETETDVVNGQPPDEFERIKLKIESHQNQNTDDPVDYMFELPLELAASICGYQAGQTHGLEWKTLQRSAPSRRASKPPVKSLSAAIKSEILPLLQSLGWQFSNPKPSFWEPGEIIRQVEGLKQTIWLDFASGHESYIIVNFYSVRKTENSIEYIVTGHIQNYPIDLPLWKRFSWTHLRNLTTAKSTPINDVNATIEKAKEEIRIAVSFLELGKPDPRIYADAKYIDEKTNIID